MIELLFAKLSSTVVAELLFPSFAVEDEVFNKDGEKNETFFFGMTDGGCIFFFVFTETKLFFFVFCSFIIIYFIHNKIYHI